ncbi:MAG: XRE family transcriptional regulator [Alphaproteobacteria bacterium HGW-Alphaproteobacteria-3]|nr:MAG: XRE family transcriptional regulator [Alphaproteobacteria bacterium HGW-Alphaproteobacteria-3]
MSLADKIHALRLEKNQSLQDVADVVGVSKAHIWQIEKNRADNPSMGLVTRLADHFGVTVAWLVSEDFTADATDSALARMFRQAHELDPQDITLLDDMLQSLLKRRKSLDGPSP